VNPRFGLLTANSRPAQVQSSGARVGAADCRELRSLLEEYVRLSRTLCACRVRVVCVSCACVSCVCVCGVVFRRLCVAVRRADMVRSCCGCPVSLYQAEDWMVEEMPILERLMDAVRDWYVHHRDPHGRRVHNSWPLAYPAWTVQAVLEDRRRPVRPACAGTAVDFAGTRVPWSPSLPSIGLGAL
jgi:hypothetical protein